MKVVLLLVVSSDCMCGPREKIFVICVGYIVKISFFLLYYTTKK